MDTIVIPASGAQKVSQFRHLELYACRIDIGEIAELSSRTSKPLQEIWIFPRNGSVPLSQQSISPLPRLQLDLVGGEEELLRYCREEKNFHGRILEKLHLFTGSHPSDVEWSFCAEWIGTGLIIKAVVGHGSALKKAREQNLLCVS